MSGIAENVHKIYPSLYSSETAKYYSYISEWNNIYSGSPPWAMVRFNKGKTHGERRRFLLGAAKLLCDKFSTLTFSEQCDITVTVPEYKEYLDKVLNRTGFWRNLPKLLSSAYALGGCALKVYANGGSVTIDYVKANNFFPAEWTENKINSAVFQTKINRGNNYYTLIELQKVGSTTHKLFKSNVSDALGNECPVSEVYPELAEKSVYEDIKVPLFACFCPSTSNNILNSNIPMGISVFANATDTLRGMDIIFDSFIREFILGRKRVIVPVDMMQPIIDTETGTNDYYFDTDDEVFVALNMEDAENGQIIDNSAVLRVQEHITAINTFLDILSIQSGLSAGAISFDMKQGLKTATEVLSDNNETANTIKDNKNQLNETLETTFHAILNLAFALGVLKRKPYEITIGWKDNVIIDDNTLIDNTIKVYNAGLLDLKTAVMQVNKCDEKTADEIVAKIKAEQSVGSADFFGDNPKTEE